MITKISEQLYYKYIARVDEICSKYGLTKINNANTSGHISYVVEVSPLIYGEIIRAFEYYMGIMYIAYFNKLVEKNSITTFNRSLYYVFDRNYLCLHNIKPGYDNTFMLDELESHINDLEKIIKIAIEDFKKVKEDYKLKQIEKDF